MSATEHGTGEPYWLDAEQLATWQSFMKLSARVSTVLGAQLQRDAQLSFTEYYVLALLSAEEGRRMRMSDLAFRGNVELSRLSHMASRLEKRGILRREPDPADGRCREAVLTDDGFACLTAAAPAHVRCVRELFFDPLDRDDLKALEQCARKVTERIDEGLGGYEMSR